MNTVFVKSFEEPEVNISEIVRYMGGDAGDCATLSLVDGCLAECRSMLSYNICYSAFPVEVLPGSVSFPFAEFKSEALAKNLCGCTEAVLFAATIGLAPDRLISRYGSVSPSKSLAFQAIGAERIEALCDGFCGFLKLEYEKQNLFLRPRFSPGYGDFSIEYQRDIFRVLDCPRKIGLSLNDSMIMSPSKSVTAIVGISAESPADVKNKCKSCGNIKCTFRH